MISFLFITQAWAQDASALPMVNEEMSFGWLFVKTILAMIFILAMAFGFIRYLLPKLQGQVMKSSSRIQVIDRAGLEPRRALYVVKVGKKAALLSSSESGVTKVMDLDPEDL